MLKVPDLSPMRSVSAQAPVKTPKTPACKKAQAFGSVERLVWPSECAKLLGTNVGTISAAKKTMGIHRKKVFPSEMEKFFKENPGFDAKAVYAKS